MRINSVNNYVAFNALQQKCMAPMHITEEKLEICRKKVANTKFIDIILDSHGFAIKEKMTEFIQRIQSFSLFPKDNVVSINMIGDIENCYKFKYDTLEIAKKEWEKISDLRKKNNPEYYTEFALWLDKNFNSQKRI